MSFKNLLDDSLLLKSFSAELIFADGNSFFIKNTSEKNDHGHFKPRLTISRKMGCPSEICILQYFDSAYITSEYETKHGKLDKIKINLVDSMTSNKSQDKCEFKGEYKVIERSNGTNGAGTGSYAFVGVDIYSSELSDTYDNTTFKPAEGKEDAGTFANFFKLILSAIGFSNGETVNAEAKDNNNDTPKIIKLKNSKCLLDNLCELGEKDGYLTSYVGGNSKLLLHSLKKDDFNDLGITFTEPKGSGVDKKSKTNIISCVSLGSNTVTESINTMYHDGTKTFVSNTKAKQFLGDLLLNNNSDCLNTINSFSPKRNAKADDIAKIGKQMCLQMLDMNTLELIVPGHFEYNNICTIVDVKKHIIDGNKQADLDNTLSGKWYVTQVHYIVTDYKFVSRLELKRIDNPTEGNPALENAKTSSKSIAKADLKPLEHKKNTEYKESTEYKKLCKEFSDTEVDNAISEYMYVKNGSSEFPHDPSKLSTYLSTVTKNNVNLARKTEATAVYNAINASGQKGLGNMTLQSGYASVVKGTAGDLLPNIGAVSIEELMKVVDGETIDNPSIFFISEFKKYFKNYGYSELDSLIDGGKKPSSYLTENLYNSWVYYWYEKYADPYYTFVCDVYRKYDEITSCNNSTLEFNGKNSTNSKATKAIIQKSKEE